jgi:hypothetical protein
MSEKNDKPVTQPTEPESEHTPVVYSSGLAEGHGPMERIYGVHEETKPDNQPFHLMGASGYEYTLDKINDETREEFHRLDMKRRLEAGAEAAGKSKKTNLL